MDRIEKDSDSYRRFASYLSVRGTMLCGMTVCVFAILGVSLGRAQDPPIPSALKRPVDRQDEGAPPPADAPPFLNFPMGRDHWRELIYSPFGGSDSGFELWLRRQVRIALNRIDHLCGLSDEIRAKVQATADLEVQRFDADIASLLLDAPVRPTAEEYQAFYGRIAQLTAPLRLMVSDAEVGPATLWQKVLVSHLTPEQAQLVQQDTQRRKAMDRHTEGLETLLSLSYRLGLTARQRGALEPYVKSNPENWRTLPIAWATLQGFPDEEKNRWFSHKQREQLAQSSDGSTVPIFEKQQGNR